MSLAVISRQRDGVASSVSVIVWYRNSVVTARMPSTKAGTYAV
jgi:hypothetical protein